MCHCYAALGKCFLGDVVKQSIQLFRENNVFFKYLAVGYGDLRCFRFEKAQHTLAQMPRSCNFSDKKTVLEALRHTLVYKVSKAIRFKKP